MAYRKGQKKSISKAEYQSQAIKKQFDAFIQSIRNTERLPWRNVYDMSFRPFSARKFLENYKKLSKLDIPEQEKYIAARSHSHYAKLNGITLWAKAVEGNRKYCATGTQHFFTKIVPEEYPDFVLPGAEYTGVKRNEKMVPLNAFYPIFKKEEDGSPAIGPNGEKLVERMNHKLYHEFFVEQAVGLNLEKFAGPPVEITSNQQKVIDMVNDVSDRLGVPIVDVPGSDNASFSFFGRVGPGGEIEITGQQVSTPPVQAYSTPGEYTAALAHEFAHATHFQFEREAFLKSPQRVGTPFEGMSDDVLKSYKEVVAEFSAASLAIETGILTRAELDNSANYVKGFISQLDTLESEGKHQLLYRAASVADRVMSYMAENTFERSIDIDQYIKQVESDAQLAIDDHNQNVAKWAGKDISELTDQDRLAYVKSQIPDFEVENTNAQVQTESKKPKIELTSGLSR